MKNGSEEKNIEQSSFLEYHIWVTVALGIMITMTKT